MSGLTDKPAVVDAFNIESYISGLSNFIMNCTTPMTISIQGDWGTGKTSVMAMVQERLPENICKVWFNTWQFSQFNMGEQLPVFMMTKLIDEIEDQADAVKSKSKEVVAKILKISASMALGQLSGGSVTHEDVSNLLAGDFFKEFETLKETFQKLIDKKAGESGKVVIFIDDLDRLAPGRAVELLEVLKIFLDCEKCVFVLAIDYSVVSRGVKEKYGSDFEEEKGKSFFDKIIQVPFKMPVASYDITNYVKTCFGNIGIMVADSDLPKYVNLINHSIGNNPRGMKRLFNSYLLLSNIATDEVLKQDNNKSLLFAILCMQSKFEKMYNLMVNNRFDVDKQYVESLRDEHNAIYDEIELGDKEKSEFIRFVGDLVMLIDTNGEDGIDDTEMLAFKNVLNFSTITSAGSESMEVDDEQELSYRYIHRDVCREMLKKMREQEEYKEYSFCEYYTRTHDRGCWWIYIRNERGTYKVGKETPVRFGYEIRLEPPKDSTSNKSNVVIGIYKIDVNKEKTSVDEILDVMGENPLPEFGIPNVTNGGIYYEKVDAIDCKVDSERAKVYDIFIRGFEELKKYFEKQ